MNKHNLLRIIDVNFNRAREATRVIEDYTRFVLDNDFLTNSLREIRHKLTGIIKKTSSTKELIIARNTEDDIGKESVSKTTSEIVIANFKRLQESLRSIAEHLKPIKPKLVGAIEKLRFSAYQLEQTLIYHLFPKDAFNKVQLYALLSSPISKKPLLETAKQIIKGGADAIQLREKDIPDKKLIAKVYK